MTRLAALVTIATLALSAPAGAQPPAAEKPTSLDALLQLIRDGGRADREADARREAEFRAARDQQAALLAAARAAQAAEEARSAALEDDFEANEKVLPELGQTLREKLGTLGELFGVVRHVAGDTLGFTSGSLVSAQLGPRRELLGKLAESKELPSIEDLEQLWFILQQEMTEAGKVVRFPATVVDADGTEQERQVVRIGPFNVIADGRYLQYVPETGQLTELPSQPAGRHLATVRDFETASGGLVGVAIDPSRGSILSLLIQTPSLGERIRQGGIVGYVIIALGLVGFAVAMQRLVHLWGVTRRMKAQASLGTASTDNPLGRVLHVYEENPTTDVETLELKLDEAILSETPALERGNAFVKVVSVAAPLLGLLGTVTGMIQTFQAITLFGTGDPKLMAGGISQALVTTVLGLSVAIPLLLIHALLSGQSRALVEVLEEQTAGFIARHAERLKAGGGDRA
jgi:biopolymer transport protein ExbB